MNIAERLREILSSFHRHSCYPEPIDIELDNAIELIISEFVPPERSTSWRCKARQSSTPDPQDCGWPVCGCDPYADKVIAAYSEIAEMAPSPSRPGAPAMTRERFIEIMHGAIGHDGELYPNKWKSRLEAAADAILAEMPAGDTGCHAKLEAAARLLWADARRTGDHTEWFKSISDIAYVLEEIDAIRALRRPDAAPARASVSVEDIAIWLLQRDEKSSPEWARTTIMNSRDEVHAGDCDIAEQKAPITCMRCVYEDYTRDARAVLALFAKERS